MKPSYMVIGGVKCASSSLYRYINAHPEVLPCQNKEPGYFNTKNPIKLLYKYPAYKNLYPKIENNEVVADWLDLGSDGKMHASSIYKKIKPGVNYITGEATATTWFAGNKRLIKFLYPEIKLIMLVRDPAERFISHYNMLTRFHNEGRKGYDLGELSGFVDKEIASFNSNQKTRILSQGIYINELLEWRKLFGDQLLVLPTENLQSEDAHTVMDKVARYLNLSEFDFKDTVNVRYNSTGKKIGDSGELQRLKEFYRPYNVRLNEHFEIDLDKKLERYEN